MRSEREPDAELDLLLEECGVDPDTELRDLLRAARHGRTELSEEESRELSMRVLAGTRAQPHRRGGGPIRWVAGLAAALAVGALLWPRERAVEPAAGVVVKEVFFESVHQGKAARLEMTLYRMNRQE